MIRIILNLLHRGSSDIKHAQCKEEVEQTMNLLGIKITSLDLSVSCISSKPKPLQHATTSIAYYNPLKYKLKLREEKQRKRKQVNPLDAQNDLTRQLSEIAMDCNFPNCGSDVSLTNLSEHFRKHISETEASEGNINQAQLFSCVICQKEFQFRRALNSHTKKCKSVKREAELVVERVETKTENEEEEEEEPLRKRQKVATDIVDDESLNYAFASFANCTPENEIKKEASGEENEQLRESK